MIKKNYDLLHNIENTLIIHCNIKTFLGLLNHPGISILISPIIFEVNLRRLNVAGFLLIKLCYKIWSDFQIIKF